MRKWIVDGFDKEAWQKIKETIRRGNFIGGDDVFGQIMCGGICFDLTLRDTNWINDKCAEFVLCADAFLLGENTGYGYTTDGTPYDYGDWVVLKFNKHTGYAQTREDFIAQIDKAVANDKIWSEFADKTDLTWEKVK